MLFGKQRTEGDGKQGQDQTVRKRGNSLENKQQYLAGRYCDLLILKIIRLRKVIEPENQRYDQKENTNDRNYENDEEPNDHIYNAGKKNLMGTCRKCESQISLIGKFCFVKPDIKGKGSTDHIDQQEDVNAAVQHKRKSGENGVVFNFDT